jgi:beta-carotene 3-hydroxylase
MEALIWIGIILITFFGMEFMAWFTHKFIMHGFLWVLHKDHHKKDHDSWFERNDAFFIFYAIVSIGCFLLWKYEIFTYGFPIGIGIFIYGFTYFMVHDIFIHQRFKILKTASSRYGKAVRRAHKMHHRHIGKQDSECFGMLLFPYKYYRDSK